jgi:hypothetical protein
MDRPTTLFFVGLAAAVFLSFIPIYLQQLTRCYRDAPWSLPIVVACCILLADVQGRIATSGVARYAAVLAVLLIAYCLGTGKILMPRIRIAVLALCLYVILGSLVGKLLFNTQTGALAIGISLVPLTFRSIAGSDRPCRHQTGLRAVAVVSLAFSALILVQRLGYLPQAALVFNHERTFITVLGTFAAFAIRSTILILLNLSAALATFLIYPAATVPIAFLVALATIGLSSQLVPRKLRRITLFSAGLAGVWALLNIDRLLVASGAYFEAVGKHDNSVVRRELYAQAFSIIAKNPWWSSGFTGEVSIPVTLSGTQTVLLPAHNDFLTLALGGGFVAAGLAMGIVLLVNNHCFQGVRKKSATPDPHGRTASIVLLASFNAGAASAFANPVLINPQSGVLLCTIALAACSLASAMDDKLSQNVEAFPLKSGFGFSRAGTNSPA